MDIFKRAKWIARNAQLSSAKADYIEYRPERRVFEIAFFDSKRDMTYLVPMTREFVEDVPRNIGALLIRRELIRLRT